MGNGRGGGVGVTGRRRRVTNDRSALIRAFQDGDITRGTGRNRRNLVNASGDALTIGRGQNRRRVLAASSGRNGIGLQRVGGTMSNAELRRRVGNLQRRGLLRNRRSGRGAAGTAAAVIAARNAGPR